MKVMVVDDEPLAQQRLISMINELGDYELAARASNGAEAVQVAAEYDPEIILLDVRMPIMDGLEAARHLSCLETPPAIIFTTAYEEHALEAFNTNAIAYLMKPVQMEKLTHALQKARRPNRAQMVKIQSVQVSDQIRKHICARVRGNLELIPIEDVYYFRADHKYVAVYHTNGSLLIEEPLKALEDEFEETFIRVHRNALVCKRNVSGLEKSIDGRFHVRVTGVDEALEVSRRHVSKVRKFIRER